MLKSRRHLAGLAAIMLLSISLVECSGSGGNASSAPPTARPTASPTPSPTPTPVITFAGTTVTSAGGKYSLSVDCDTFENFTIAETGYTGNFTLSNSGGGSFPTGFTVSPLTGNAATSFEVVSPATSQPSSFGISVAGAPGTTGLLTVNYLGCL